MRLLTLNAEATPSLSKLSLSLASTPEEVREVQRLRYKVFVKAMGLSGLFNQEGLDRDALDDYCDHLIVRDTKTLKVVGTYRVLSPHAARQFGRFYSEQEFDISRLDHLRGRIAEAGRACIHPDYRGGGVIMLLWAGLAAFMKKEKCDYLIGCASISLADGGHNATAISHALNNTHLSPAEYRVTPRLAFPIHERDPHQTPLLPPLIKGYLKSGAWVCGDPAWDPDFHCADLFMLLPLARLDGRYARHYLKDKETS
ncbi:MAG: GNAT family N-acyltransferase [Pseudomonadota bacterium]